MTRARVRVTWLDLVILAALAGFAAYVGFRVELVLKYSWAWSRALPYLVRWDEAEHRWALGLLGQGLLTTIRLALWGMVLAAALGLVFGICRTSRSLFLRLVAGSYVGFVRNIPPLVFVFLFYFVLSSELIPLLGIDRAAAAARGAGAPVVMILFGAPELLVNFASGLLCLSLFEGAYITEIVRAGIQSVPAGQWDAGRSLGLRRLQIMRTIVLPQALRAVLPPLASQFIMLIKTSSIVSLISIQELTFAANEAASSSFHVFELWIIAAGLYFVLCAGCAAMFGRLERGGASRRAEQRIG